MADDGRPAKVNKTSLQRIQSLEQDCPEFLQQLTQVASILKSPKILSTEFASQQDGFETLSAGSSSRHEWALKWIINKLSADSDSHKVPQSWLLLGNLVSCLPSGTIAKIVGSNKLLATISRSLEDIITSDRPGVVPTTGNIDTDSAPLQYVREGHTLKADFPEVNGLKRKRDGTDGSFAEQDLSRQDHTGIGVNQSENPSSFVLLFESIARVLLWLGTKLSAPSSAIDASSVEHLKASLRLPVTQSAKLLGLWLSAITSLSDAQLSGRSPELYDLALILKFWEDSITVDGNEVGATSSAFSQAGTLLAASSFLCRFKDNTQPLNRDNLLEVTLADNVSAVEVLIAKHVFIPAKRNDTAAQDSGNNDIASQESLREYLSPLRSFFTSSTPAKRSPEVLAELNFDIVSLLFEIAIRVSQLSTPQKRLRSHPWLEKVMLSLAWSVGIDFVSVSAEEDSSSSDLEAVSNVHGEALDQMLEIALSYRLKLSRTALEPIIKDFSGIKTSNSGSINWSLVSKILKIHPDLLIVNRRVQSFQDLNPMEALGHELMRAITSSAWSKSITQPREGSAAQKESTAYTYVLDNVIIPLLRAYASARGLKTFVDWWREQLEEFRTIPEDEKEVTDEDIDRIESCSVWEDRALGVAFAEIFETSLAPKQIADILNGCMQEIDAAISVAMDQSDPWNTWSKIDANATLLRFLVAAITSNDTRIAAQERIVNTCRSMKTLLSMGIASPGTAARLWLCLSTACRTLVTTATGDVLFVIIKEILEPLVSLHQRLEQNYQQDSRIYKTPSKVNERIAAASCIGSIVTELRNKNVALEKMDAIEDYMWASLESLWNLPDQAGAPTPLQSSEQLAMAMLVAQFPTLLGSDEPAVATKNARKDALGHLAELAIGGTEQQLDTEFFSCWMSILEYARDSVRWLELEILSILERLLDEQVSGDKKRAGQHNVEIFLVRSFRQFYILLSDARLDNLRMWIVQISTRHDAQIISVAEFMLLLDLMSGLSKVALGIEAKPRDQLTSILDPLEGVLNSVLESEGVTYDDVANLTNLWEGIIDLSLMLHFDAFSPEERASFFAEAFTSRGQFLTTNFSGRPATVARVHRLLACLASSGFTDRKQLRGIELEFYQNICEELQRDQAASTMQRSFAMQHVCLDVLRRADFVAMPESNVQSLVDNLTGYLNSEALNAATDAELQSLKVAAFCVKCKALMALSGELSHDILLAAGLKKMSPKAKMMLETTLEEFLKNTSKSITLDFAKQLSEDGSEGALMLVPIIISRLIDSSSEEPPTQIELNSEDHGISSLFSILSHRIAADYPTTRDTETDQSEPFQVTTFKSLADSIMQFLSNAPHQVSQSEIEGLLLTVCKILSRNGLNIHQKHSTLVYLRLCQMVSAILLHHRKRLRGRYHLLLPILQSLLRCLFIPQTKLLIQPRWLSPRSRQLGAKQAAALTRLFTLLCEPTASSVQQSNPARGKLTDERQKARRYAGQYAPAILLEYANCLLHGRLPAGTRAALAPGIYALFDAAVAAGRSSDGDEKQKRRDREGDVLAAMNASASGPAKSVLRGLWSEYKKFGRWSER